MALHGIDVSTHNGHINWSALYDTGEVDFVIIRAGYGRNNIDAEFIDNVVACIQLEIPFGIYWFSYALSELDAKHEGEYAIQAVIDYFPPVVLDTFLMGVWYDWEYDSDTYAQQQGVTITNNMRTRFAKAFIEAVNNRGYAAGIYTNLDYLSRGMQPIVDEGYPLWLAQWDVTDPSLSCNIWQYGTVDIYYPDIQPPVLLGTFDGNYIGDDYPPIPIFPKKKKPLFLYLKRIL